MVKFGMIYDLIYNSKTKVNENIRQDLFFITNL